MIKSFTLFLLILFTACGKIAAQKVDSIFFHLYTDSLKKGQHNYINVDGKLSNGKWWPLTSKEITLSCSVAVFQGNELIIPADFTGKNVTVKTILKSNPAISIERVIWIKQLPDPPLPAKEDIINNPSPADKKTKRRN
jgi:hypothetical protein